MPAGVYERKGLIERFWEKVQKSESCWLWTASTFWDGYGQIGLDGKKMRAHRLSYEINIGEIPEGLLVCHSCDNPRCVRPEHLFLGSQADNAQDMILKERSCRGTKNSQAKLSKEDVVKIRDM